MDKNNTGPEMVEPGDQTTEGDLGYFEQWLAEFEWLRVIFSDGSIITKLPVLQPPETREQTEIASLREAFTISLCFLSCQFQFACFNIARNLKPN